MMPPVIDLSVLGLDLPVICFPLSSGSHVSRPITDHPPLIQNTYFGPIATINILNPGSPLAPPMQINGVQCLPSNGQQQMELMAAYLFKMFEKGVGLLALQEVPDPGAQKNAAGKNNFDYLFEALDKLNKGKRLVDVNALRNQWINTKPHAFGTSILYNPALFTHVEKDSSHLLKDHAVVTAQRAVIYKATTKSGDMVMVANVHGDFKKQAETIDFVTKFDGFCLGDLNVTLTEQTKLSTPECSVVASTLTIEGSPCTLNTVDCVKDPYSGKKAPGFLPAVDRITPAADRPPLIPFTPKVVKVDAIKAQSILSEFTTYIKANHPELFVGQRIVAVSLTTPPGSYTANITISDQAVSEAFDRFLEITMYFSQQKKCIQEQFIANLNALKTTTISGGKNLTASQLYDILMVEQQNFFEHLSFSLTQEEVKQYIASFRNQCKKFIKDSDRIMGHGWLYRIVEIAIKAIVGLFAGLGMVVGAIIGQGLAKAEHRQAFKDTFFTLNQTEASKALNVFEQRILGDDRQDQGLLDPDKLSHR